ncbi:TonB-dependent receptor [Paludibacter jiangxiensis]|uniref:Iron complex outermembrane recepter protein n=1 Tax=Paludibacter jiangxiensis TaxID=681398 RepID=A0A171AN65_9BACT|nr:TonB-dependent receptor [Paludibacter jiangxiensis]GAT64018.1 iron complex outermembrane recepter protein [Paludibacter jiangxiensis]
MKKLRYFLFLLVLVMATSAFAQQKKVTLSLEKVTVKAALEALKSQSGLSYWFDANDVNMQKIVSVNVNGKSVDEALKVILQGQDVRFEVKNDHIVITKVNAQSQKASESQAFGEPRRVSGKITDEKGNLLPGVTVMVKGTSAGTISDVNGHYEMNKVPAGAILEFSFVGMTNQSVKVGSQSIVNVSLKEMDTKLNEIVVVGYGTTTKKGLVSSVTSVKTDELNKGAITDVGQLLQGKAAGLNVTVSGDPTRKSSVILRGTSTLNSSMEPFYVIDGIPGADISLVAPDDIETIDVLKDAAATSIYGNRAANGIIMVTTKKGKKGVTHISYNGYAGIENVTNSLKLMNGAQLRDFCKTTNQNLTEDTGADTDWQKSIQRSTAYSTNHNLSFNGGSEHNSYSASLNYSNKQGIIQTSNQSKVVARVTFDQYAFNDKVKFGLSVANARVVSDYVPLLGAVLYQTAYHLPTSPVKNADGSYFENFTKNGYFNPSAIINNAQSQSKNNNLIAAFTINAKLPFGLTYDMSLSYQNYNALYGEYYNSYLYQYNGSVFYNNPDPPSTRTIVTFQPGGSAMRNNYQTTNTVFENWLTWNRTFGAHSINAVLGYSFQNDIYGDGFQATNANFPVNNMSFNNLALGNYSTINGYRVDFGYDQAYSKTRLISNFARLNYNYNDKYYLQGSLRRDGGSVFGKNNRWGYFPSVGVSWRAGQESFIQKMNIFYDLKFRGSYGVTGNSTGFSAYTAQFLSGPMGSFNYNGGSMMSYGPNKAANPDLKWEKTATTNFGLDASLLQGKLSFTFDWYNKNTTDMIYWYDADILLVPAAGLWANGGSINNKGIEFSISATPVKTRTFTWKTSLNLAHNKNTITGLSNPYFSGGDSIRYTQPDGGGQTGSTLQIRKVGYPLGQFFTLIYQGKNSAGVSQYLAKDGTLTTNPTTSDYRYAGSPQPKLNYGWSNSFTYKNFDLSIFLRGVYGNKIFNATRADLFRPSTAAYTNILVDAANESAKDGNAFRYSSRFIESGSYLRLENLTLGYTFKKPIKYIENVRLYSTVNNLFVITKYTGVDPEVNMGGMSPGIDSNNFYPKTRTILFGVNVNF